MQKTLYQKKHNNMKKLVIIMLVLLTMTQNSTAQTAGGETKIFPMVGLTLSKMNNDIILTDAGNGQGDELKPKYKFGITAGAEVRHRFKNNDFGFSAGLLYAMYGTKYSDHTYINEQSYGKVTNSKQTLHYLTIPVMAIYYFGNSGFSIKAGVQAGYLLSAKGSNDYENGTIENGQYIPDTEQSGEASNTTTGIFKRFDIGIPVGVAYEYNNISIDLRYLFGLKNPYKYYVDNIRNRSFSLTVGYGFTL